MVIRVASFFPFQATYYLNGHSFMEQELNQRNIGFRKNDNAFLSTDVTGRFGGDSRSLPVDAGRRSAFRSPHPPYSSR